MTTQLLETSPTFTATIHDFKVSCGHCKRKSKCLPLSLPDDEIEKLDSIISHEKLLQPKQHIFREGDKFKSLYIVRTGALKTYHATQAGQEQIYGFYFPGHLLGQNGIFDDMYTSSAVALGTSAVCEICYHSLEVLCAGNPDVQRLFFTLLSREIIRSQQLMMLLGKHSAEQRVSTFLQELVDSNIELKLSASYLRLPMRRVDIANYLGLSAETISRIFSHMEELGVLRVDSREIAILNAPALLDMASLEYFQVSNDMRMSN
jgi:CRP/FNR family transcriptional regulator, anaerobic regulatory protein